MVADLRTDLSFTKIVDFDADKETELNAAVEHLCREADRWFEAEKIPEAQRNLRITLDMRYAGQNYELGIGLEQHTLGTAGITAAVASFESEHEALYGFTVPGERIQAVTFRAEASGKVVKAATPVHDDEGEDPWRALIGERGVYLDAENGYTPTPIYAREKLRTGNLIAGPAVIEQMDTTTVVLPGQTARTDAYANLIIEENEK
jgi:N-methylhydantoinase A